MIDYYLLAGLGMVTVFFAMLLLHFVSSQRLTIWHALAIGIIASFSASLVNNYVTLGEWLTLGLMGISTAAMVFVIGVAVMLAVMVYNLISTRGRTMVR